MLLGNGLCSGNIKVLGRQKKKVWGQNSDLVHTKLGAMLYRNGKPEGGYRTR